MFIFASGILCKVWKRPNLKVISWNYKQHYYIFCGHYKKRSATKVIIRVRQKQILYILFGKSQKSNTGHCSLPKVKKTNKTNTEKQVNFKAWYQSKYDQMAAVKMMNLFDAGITRIKLKKIVSFWLSNQKNSTQLCGAIASEISHWPISIGMCVGVGGPCLIK